MRTIILSILLTIPIVAACQSRIKNSLIIGEGIEDHYKKIRGAEFVLPKFPEEYRSGIGKDGVERLKKFIEDGGTLICLGDSSGFAIDEFKLPVVNSLEGINKKDFFCPGSTLHVKINRYNPLSWGVSDDLLVIFKNNAAFEVKAGPYNEKMEVVLYYPEKRIMESGWLIGEKHLSRRAALIDGKMGKGRVILFGFSPQFRAQSDASFKLLFNALFS